MNKLRKHGVYYDSRIKLLLILLTSALAFALGGGLTGLLLFGVVCLFALLSGLWKTSIKVAIVYIVLLMLAQVLPIQKDFQMFRVKSMIFAHRQSEKRFHRLTER